MLLLRISRKSLEKAINGSTLNNGKHIPYGYGWSEGHINGSEAYEHNGSIFGYTSMGIYLPNEKVFVSGLTNCNCKNITEIVKKIAAIAINKPFPKVSDAIKLTKEQLSKWVGAYQFDNNTVRHITLENRQVYSQREGSKKLRIFPLTTDKFIFKGGTRAYTFSIIDGKKQVTFKSLNENVIGKETNKTVPKAKKEVSLSEEILKLYRGKYEFNPNFIITVTTKGNKIFAQATNQPQFQLFAETETKFFLKVVKADLDFNKNDDGDIASLTLHQNGQNLECKKVK